MSIDQYNNNYDRPVFSRATKFLGSDHLLSIVFRAAVVRHIIFLLLEDLSCKMFKSQDKKSWMMLRGVLHHDASGDSSTQKEHNRADRRWSFGRYENESFAQIKGLVRLVYLIVEFDVLWCTSFGLAFLL